MEKLRPLLKLPNPQNQILCKITQKLDKLFGKLKFLRSGG